MNNLRKFYLFILISMIYPQGLNVDDGKRNQINSEILSIVESKISKDIFIHPVRQKKLENSYYNFIHNISNNLKVEPVMAFRWSNGGFEIDSLNTPTSVFWITPGVKISTTIPIINPFSSVWLYAWGRFNKHSAFGFNGNSIVDDQILFQYNPEYSSEFYVNTKKPENGIDFDSGEGGIAMMSPAISIAYGKFRSSLGPIYRGNLSISREMPPFQQLFMNIDIGKHVTFTYLLGSLYSDIADDALTEYFETNDTNNRAPVLPRYVVNHRLDFQPIPTLRIGLYEQVIIGARSLPMEYLNPLVPFWSVQHALGDLDNVQMGIDFDWIFHKNRMYGSFLMDEWSPYKSFDSDENHNWFAWQIGYSNLLKDNLLLKCEYSHLEPQIYAHKFEINIPEHHNYPIGFWSDGNSDDIWVGIFWYKGKFVGELSYEQTRFKEKEYGENIQFLNGEYKLRQKNTLKIRREILNGFISEISIGYISNEMLYKANQFTYLNFSLLYNIPF